jgi:tRNA (guanine10-N2)-dimethyltransferase
MVYKSVFILGRQPAIGRAELESLFGTGHLEPIGDHALASDIPLDDVPFSRIGGSIRLAKPLGDFPTVNWPQIAQAASKALPVFLDTLPPEGKVKLGLSTFGLPVNERQLLRTGLELKKVCKAAGRSVRLVPNVEPSLNSAQVLHNQLTGDMGIELLFIKNGQQTHLAQTVAVQDIDAYAHRDQGRPKRDAFVGMLPPKLAQTIVNLATGQLAPEPGNAVLDPFCGTGVILQEALLMGYGAYGTDLEPRMVDYSRQNLEWLATQGVTGTPILEAGDATEHHWQNPFSAVACETYLGRPLSGWPNPEKLREIIGTCNVIIHKFMTNLAAQTPSGTRLCLAIPAWQAPNGHMHHLSVLDQLEVLGYNRVSFSWASEQEMVYRRPDQLVARELLVITRK